MPEGGMSFRTPWSSWDSGTRAVSFLGELSLLPRHPVVVVVGIQTILYVCTYTSTSDLQCARVLSGKEKRELARTKERERVCA
jgi:hypothetical protein